MNWQAFSGVASLAMTIETIPEEQHILEEYGVSTLYCIEGTRLSAYSPEVFAWAAQEVLKDIPFRLLLFAHTDHGSEPCPSDCVIPRYRCSYRLCRYSHKRRYVVSMRGNSMEANSNKRSPIPYLLKWPASCRKHLIRERQEVPHRSPPVPSPLKFLRTSWVSRPLNASLRITGRWIFFTRNELSGQARGVAI